MQPKLKVDIQVITVPDHITYECPKCGEKIEVDHSEFTAEQGADYPGDWVSTICPNCETELRINDVDWEV